MKKQLKLALVLIVIIQFLCSCRRYSYLADYSSTSILLSVNRLIKAENFDEANRILKESIIQRPNDKGILTRYIDVLALIKDWDEYENQLVVYKKKYGETERLAFYYCFLFGVKRDFPSLKKEIHKLIFYDDKIPYLYKGLNDDERLVMKQLMYYVVDYSLRNGMKDSFKYVRLSKLIFNDTAIFDGYYSYLLIMAGKVNEGYTKLDNLTTPPFGMYRLISLYLKGAIRAEHSIEGIKKWRRMLPDYIVKSKENKLRPVFEGIDEAITKGRNKKNILELANLFSQIGLINEAILLFQKFKQDESVKVKLKELENLKDFILEIKKIAYDNYDEIFCSNKSQKIEEIVSKIYQVAQNCGLDISGYDVNDFISSNTGYAKEYLPFGEIHDELQKYLLKRGLFLYVTEYFGNTEIMLMPLIFRGDNIKAGAGKNVFELCVGGDSIIPNYAEYIFGYPRIAGQTFLTKKGVYISLKGLMPGKKTIAMWDDLLRNYEAPKDIRVLGISPPIMNISEKRFIPKVSKRIVEKVYKGALDLNNSAGEILSGVNTEIDPNMGFTDKQIYDYVLINNFDMVLLHESGHVQDIYDYVPFSANFFNNLMVGLQFWFSSNEINYRFENYAERYAVLNSTNPLWIFASNLEILKKRKKDFWYALRTTWGGAEDEDSVYYKIAYNLSIEVAKEIYNTENLLLKKNENIYDRFDAIGDKTIFNILTHILPGK